MSTVNGASAGTKRSRQCKTEATEIVLGGGANRGFAHCGLLQAIEELDVNTGTITGVSIGSIIATLYTNGYCPRRSRRFSRPS